MNRPRSRFAPSPTGLLHLGHAFSALWAAHVARSLGGRMLLRIDDLDQGRSRPAYVQAIFQDLAWLGIAHDGPVRHQSQHLPDYQAALARLQALGLVYPCRCTRRDIAQEVAAAAGAPHGPDGPPYPGTCRPAAGAPITPPQPGEAVAWRLDHARALAAAGPLSWIEAGPERPGRHPLQAAALAAIGDVVLGRRDAIGSYHLAVVIDDHATGVTHVTRGQDLAFAAPLHRLLQAVLGVPETVFVHHPLVLDQAGRRLAKRDDARAIAQYRAAGLSPQAVMALLPPLPPWPVAASASGLGSGSASGTGSGSGSGTTGPPGTAG